MKKECNCNKKAGYKEGSKPAMPYKKPQKQPVKTNKK